MVECPECAADIEVANVEEGEILSCPECGAELEVRGIDPVKLAVAPKEEEDWGE
jgi:alpha-aminoadipate/glutamate carrier protein LysW